MCIYIHMYIIYIVLYPPMSSNMASWEIPELNGVFFFRSEHHRTKWGIFRAMSAIVNGNDLSSMIFPCPFSSWLPQSIFLTPEGKLGGIDLRSGYGLWTWGLQPDCWSARVASRRLPWRGPWRRIDGAERSPRPDVKKRGTESVETAGSWW